MAALQTAPLPPAPLPVQNPHESMATASRTEPLERRATARLEPVVAARPGAHGAAPRGFFVITLAGPFSCLDRGLYASSPPFAVAGALRPASSPPVLLLTVPLARPDPRPLARSLPARSTAVALKPVPGPEPLLASLEQTAPQSRATPRAAAPLWSSLTCPNLV
jgi:hypothetical protein